MTLRAWSFTSGALLALAAAGCSDPVPPAPRGNLAFTITGCTNYNGGIGAQQGVDAPTAYTQLPATDGTRPGRRLEDGQEGASIRCLVDGGNTNRIEASITGSQSHPAKQFVETVGIEITNGFITKNDAGGGEGLADINVITGGVTYTPVVGTNCTLSINSARSDSSFTVDAGRVYARFDCANLEDPPVDKCQVTGAFVLERCRED